MGANDSPAWQRLKRFTQARIGLGRTGASMPTREVLAFALAHARARDAVHSTLDVAALGSQLSALDLAFITVASKATEKALYLSRPDLGRRLCSSSKAMLAARPPTPFDVCFIVGDGLSSRAVQTHAVPVVSSVLRQLDRLAISSAPLVIARGARVALSDEIGAALNARIAVILIGERPGLSSPDSMGIYLTFAPQPERSDADRNCISNVRPEGLSYDLAADRLVWLIREALRLGRSGVTLKDDSDQRIEGAGAGNALRAP